MQAATQQKKRQNTLSLCIETYFAESEGFEPPDPCRSTVFKTAAIDHSANFPRAKVVQISHFAKFHVHFLLQVVA